MTLSHLCASYHSQLKNTAAELMAQEMPPITEKDFALFEQNGNRLVYENIYFARRKFLTVFGILALEEQADSGSASTQTMHKLSDVLVQICHEKCWALPAHLSRSNPGWEYTIDLFAAETAQTVAELADRLRAQLSPEIVQLVQRNVEQRILRPFLANRDGFGWEGADHNWNAVICGSIGSACLHLMRSRPEILVPCLERVCASFPGYLDGFSADGACLEGLGYYFYGVSYFVNFAQELYRYTNGKTDLLENERFKRIAGFWPLCYFPDGRTVNFSDNSDREKFPIGLALALHRRFGVPVPALNRAAGLTHDHCWRFVFRKMDLYELRAAKDSPAQFRSLPTRHLLPDAQWYIAASQNGVGFACKGGHNGEPHNHNDLGHFIYEANGTVLLADLGAGEYTAEYFSSRRYSILCNSSLGHSVPLVGGKGQLPGKDHRCTLFRAEGERVELELAQAYEGLVAFRRTLEFSQDTGTLTVCDRFKTELPVTENLITCCPPTKTGNGILLQGESASAMISIENADVPGMVTIEQCPHSDHHGKPQTVWKIQWPAASEARFTVYVLTGRQQNG